MTTPTYTANQQLVVDLFATGGVVSATCRSIADSLGKTPQAVAGIVTSLTKRSVLRVDSDGMVTAHESLTTESDVPANMADAVAAARARREAGTALEITPSGKVAKMVRITLDLRISTDGNWIVAKTGEGDTAWTLYRVAPGAGRFPIRTAGTFATCTAAFAPANLT